MAQVPSVKGCDAAEAEAVDDLAHWIHACVLAVGRGIVAVDLRADSSDSFGPLYDSAIGDSQRAYFFGGGGGGR